MDSTDEHVAFAVDLTQLKQAEAALQASQQRYRDLAEAMPQIVWTAEATGAVNYWNQRWYKYTGLSEAESMGLAGISTVHPDDRDRTLAQWSQSLAKGESFEIEYRIRRWDGTYRWFITRALPTRDGQGQITGWIGTITDIDDRKQSEASLRESQAQLQQQLAEIEAIYQSAPIGLNVLDRELRFVRINRRLADINGLPVEAHIGRTVRELLPELADTAEQLLRPILETGEDYAAEYRIRNADGAERWVIARGRVEYDANGNAIAFPGALADISDRKQTEEALRRSEDRLRMAIESAQLGTWDWNLTTERLTWDAGCKAMFGLPPEAQTSIEVFFEALHPDDREPVERVIQRSLNPASGGNYNVEYRTIGIQDGIERWIAAKEQVYFDSAGKPQRFIVAKILRGKLNLKITSVNLSSAIAAAIKTLEMAATAKSISLHQELPNIGRKRGTDSRDRADGLCQRRGSAACLKQWISTTCC
jgi:PAS domain S-box-containing protein